MAAKKQPAKKKAAAPAKGPAEGILEKVIRRAIEKLPMENDVDDLTQYQRGEIDAWLDILLFINPPEGYVNKVAQEVIRERNKAKKEEKRK